MRVENLNVEFNKNLGIYKSTEGGCLTIQTKLGYIY